MTGEPPHVDLERADAYGRAFADVYDVWYRDVTDAEATARFVADRHPRGPVLELGVGTGRLARPLAARGLTVVGLDASAAMLAHCRLAAPPAATGSTAPDPVPGPDPMPGPVLAIRADMRALPLRPAPPGPGGAGPGAIGTVLLAFNTFFNLTSEGAQRRLLADLAGLLDPGGSIIIETLDPTPLLDGPVRSIGQRHGSTDPLVVTATQIDRAGQLLTGQHVEIGDGGVTIRPWALRWVTPPQLDRLASEAGLALSERWGSWSGEPLTPDSASLISVYRRADGHPGSRSGYATGVQAGPMVGPCRT